MSIELHFGDITLLPVDGIVNAANLTLLGGGGVDGAIHRAAGPGLKIECRALPEIRPGVRCATGDVRVTAGHGLKARHILHTVGPVWRDGLHDESALLANCYWRCLQQAQRLSLTSLAIPAISCGAYGFPLQRAARIALSETAAWTRCHPAPSRILLVTGTEAVFQAYVQAAQEQGLDITTCIHDHSPVPQVRRVGLRTRDASQSSVDRPS